MIGQYCSKCLRSLDISSWCFSIRRCWALSLMLTCMQQVQGYDLVFTLVQLWMVTNLKLHPPMLIYWKKEEPGFKYILIGWLIGLIDRWHINNSLWLHVSGFQKGFIQQDLPQKLLLRVSINVFEMFGLVLSDVSSIGKNDLPLTRLQSELSCRFL